MTRLYSGPFTEILNILSTTSHYAIGDFLSEFFGPGLNCDNNDKRATGRSMSHGRMLGHFLRGRGFVGVGSVLQQIDDAAKEFYSRDHGSLWALDNEYKDLKPGLVALTSYAAQKVLQRLRDEQRAATDPHAGLHVFEPRKPGQEDTKLRISWDSYGATTLSDIQAVLQEHQPLTFSYIFQLAHPGHHNEEQATFRYRPPNVVATEVICQINYAHNRNAKRLQVFNGILYYSSGASHTILGHTSRMGITPSYSNILHTLEELSKDEAKKLAAIGNDPGCGLDLVFDNVQTYAKQWEKRIGREDVMKVGMAATAVEIVNFNPEVVKLERRRQLVGVGKKKKVALTVDSILSLLNADHAQTVGALHWLQILTTYVPQLEPYKGQVRETFRTQLPTSMRLDREGVRRSTVHPLATSAKSETSIGEFKDGLVDFLQQMGQTPSNHQDRIVFAGGDGLTFEKLGNLKRAMQTQDSPFETFEILQPYLQLWHTEWTDLCRLFTAHFREERSMDPSTLAHSSAKIGFKRPANPAKVDYYPGSHHVYRVLDARILDCWRLQFGVENLWTHFGGLDPGGIPSFESLFVMAKSLWTSYSSPSAVTSFVEGCHIDRSVVPMGEQWRAEEDTDAKPVPGDTVGSSVKGEEGGDEDKKKKRKGKDTAPVVETDSRGDHTLARSAAFMYEALVSKEVAQAVAEGDIGRVYEGIKAMLVTFAGSSHSKYTNYVLEMIGFLECDTDQELRTMFLQNWLVNPSGEPGRYIEKDLMQEHHNAVLEERLKKQGTSWDSKQMRDIHSRTVEHIERIKKELRPALNLFPKGWKHTKPHDRPEIKILLDVYSSAKLHVFRPGRQYRSSLGFVDEFTQGVERLQTKVDKWKTDLIHSDIGVMSVQAPKELNPEDDEGDPNGPTSDDDESDNDEGVVGIAQTEGHRVLVDGEMHMITNDGDEHDDVWGTE